VVRAWAFGFLTVVAPVHAAMAAMLVHPALDRPKFIGVAVVVWLGLFAAAVSNLRDDAALSTKTWVRVWFVRLYLAPLTLLIAIHLVVVFVGSQPELAALIRSLAPAPGAKGQRERVEPVGPKAGPPPSAWPVVRAFLALAWKLVSSALVLVLRLYVGTPVWVWLVASGYSLLRRKPDPT
jgi:hypothetical protein